MRVTECLCSFSGPDPECLIHGKTSTGMSIIEYKERVIDLFQSGRASVEQWREMAQAVLDSSEMNDLVPLIDGTIL